MKVGRFAIWIIKNRIDRRVRKTKKWVATLDVDGSMDTPYHEGADFYERFDFQRAQGKKKGICVIDIHGGAYVLSNRKGNFRLGRLFAKNGFDYIAIDYHPNKGKRDVADMVKDCIAGIDRIFEMAEELGIDSDRFVLMGDSAGGHLSLLLAEASCDKDLADKIGFHPKRKFEVIVVNSPAYDFETLGFGTLSNSGQRRMFGPSWKDAGLRRLLSPRTHIDKLAIPLFHSTCKLDFIRGESDKLYEDCKRLNLDYEFLDIQSDDPIIGHVHNIMAMDEPDSVKVNQAMMDFIENKLSK